MKKCREEAAWYVVSKDEGREQDKCPVGLQNLVGEFWIEREFPVPLAPCPEQPAACPLQSPSIPKLPASGSEK